MQVVSSAPLNRPEALRILLPHTLTEASVQAPPAAAQLLTLAGETMGTTWSVQCLVTDARNDWRAAIEAELDDVVLQMSNWRADSDISRFNQAAAGEWVTLPVACFQVVATALHIARLSGGAYDPTAAALVNLWGFGPAPRREHAPSADQVVRARQHCGYQKIEVDAPMRRIRQPGDMALDLCAIAKGYAVDAVSAMLAANGCMHHLVEIGGELRGMGLRPDQLPWWVDLEAPPLDDAARGQTALPVQDRVGLHGLAIATSGDYRRFFIDSAQRQRYAHTLDPRTGYPASHALASVTVLHEQCMLADAWSTALTVLGPQAGMEMARRHQLAARFVVRSADGFRETLSPAYLEMLE
ncbi:FAD:protein FMN transferase [Amantichitinum ursilacus]|uniref:FAD:protein FMN transferase n=1 Tax=Amantichitinum ursilacus TaxID=857265 RepID=A0A0N0XLM4_9NEIS|nr:FAD:protein FMN transferase [Amantichitinum ursilacus]KPC54196.1 Thiamine biosynthesis lipoprotein ApbE precursor [Amantichitinum ursilacus]